MFSRREGVYYCSDEIKLLFQTLSPSIICGVLNDRVLIASSSKGTEIQARPVTMLEPLLLGVLKIKPDTEKINKIVRMMSTPLITENLIALLLNSGYPDAAWFLVEQIESNYISLELRVKIMKELNLFDEIFEKLLHKKYLEDPSTRPF